MILNSKETTIAYRCSECGKMIFSVVGVFSLSGDLFKLRCECGGSELTAAYTRDRKINITVPCVVCGNPHSFTISTDAFFGRDVFSYTCPYSGVEICLLGKNDAVIKAAEKADSDFRALLAQSGVEDLPEFAEARKADDEAQFGKIADPEMQSIVHFMLCELEDEHNISCRCKDGGHYEFKFVGSELDTVLIYCTECGASVSIPLPDAIAANAFLHTERLELT